MNPTSEIAPPGIFSLHSWSRALRLLILAQVFFLFLGCRTVQPTPLTEKELTPFASIRLREGDVVAISFPGSGNLNATPQIRRDGKIDLPLGGEMMAAGKTPVELEKDLLEHFGPQLVVKEVSVSVRSSTFPVFVSGAVIRPGKILADRPLHALEAIMEAGGFDLGRANLKEVVVIRIQEGEVKHYVLNLKLLLEGRAKQLFYLQPSDIIYVPEKAF
jgi:polysaccharide export outer membrane protein